jgi:hypothetical protein
MSTEHLINRLPEKWENKIIPLMSLHDKFVLGGSIALYILKMMEYNFEERTPDLDFSLIEPFEEQEFLTLIDFFNLHPTRTNQDYGVEGNDVIPKSLLEHLKKDLIILEHNPGPNMGMMDDDAFKEYKEEYYKVDFFNKNYLRKKDYFELDYFGTTIRLTHPSIILAAKMMYGTDIRVGKQFKHFKDIQKMDWDNYFKVVKLIKSYTKPVKNEKGEIEYYVLDKYMFGEKTPTIDHYNYIESNELPF